MPSITIELPLPDRRLHPNARAFWAAKAKQTRLYRESAWVMATLAKPNRHKPWKRASVILEFTFADKRKRDVDGLISSIKGAIDGIADAGIIENDNGITQFSVNVLPPNKAKRGVRITVTELKH